MKFNDNLEFINRYQLKQTEIYRPTKRGKKGKKAREIKNLCWLYKIEGVKERKERVIKRIINKQKKSK